MGLPVAAGPGTPVDHIAFAASDHDALVARLDGHGVAWVANFVAGPDIRQLFVHEPNGVRIELNVPPGR